MKATHETQKSSKKLPLIILFLTVAVLALGYFGYGYATQRVWPFVANTQEMILDDETNYSGPTEQEKRDSQDGKKNSPNQENSSTTSSVRNISVALAYAGYDENEDSIDIRAFTPDVIEGTGSCTAILTKGNTKITRSSPAFIDSSTSQCEPIVISESDFPSSGEWTLNVAYKSPTASGMSAVTTIKVSR